MIDVYGYNIHFVFSTMRQPYDTDLTDQQWTNIFQFFPEPNPLGRPRTQDFREILNAILYILRAGWAGGDCYLMIFPNGRRFTIIFDAGKKKAFGIRSMIIWGKKWDEKRTEMWNHQRELSVDHKL